MDDDSPLFCDRCVRQLTPGRGEFYVVEIEAVADPTPPTFREEDLQQNLRAEFAKIVKSMENLSARESMDQVHRRVTIYLCNRCYADWIENPSG